MIHQLELDTVELLLIVETVTRCNKKDKKTAEKIQDQIYEVVERDLTSEYEERRTNNNG